MEHSLLRSLLTKKFYDDTRGNLCPANLFNKDLRKIKETIDISMDSYERDLTLEELKSLFFVKNPTLTTSQKHQYEIHFNKIRSASLLGTLRTENYVQENGFSFNKDLFKIFVIGRNLVTLPPANIIPFILLLS